MKEYYRVYADINLDAICNNIKKIREIIKPETKIMGIIKADGYGHGAVPISKVLDSMADVYGVAILEEGIELRESGITKPILVLGVTPKPLYSKLVEFDIMATVFQYEMAVEIAKEAVRQNKTARIHIKIDTGMSRIGLKDNEESIKVIKKINELEGIQIEGCFTHMAKADEADKAYTYSQLRRYLDFVAKLEQEGITIALKHVSNSASIIDLPEAQLDMVRCGIATYGIYPSEEVDKSRIELEPAMELKAYVSYVKDVEKGVSVSYGGTFVTDKPTRIATVPVGYGDGYPRSLSSKGRVLIHGQSAPIIGRVCMDQFMADVTDIKNVAEGDTVTLLGKDGTERISVEELAEMSYSFPYEFICDIGKRIPRVYHYKGRKVGTSDYYNCMKEVFDLPLL